MSDLFHEQRPLSVIDQVTSVIAASRHIGQLVTKRPQRLAQYFLAPDVDGRPSWRARFWLGFSAERQQEFDERWPLMRPLATRGWILFVSAAPILGPIVLPRDFLIHRKRIWVISGGEQGAAARVRLANPDWVRALRDQCAAAGVPFFVLQMGGRERIPLDLFVREFPDVNQLPLWR
jgi:protein gp37